MTYSQITRLLNWGAIVIALGLMSLVLYQLYLRHFVPQVTSLNYQFDDLPGASEAPLTANIDEIIKQHVFGEVPKIVETREPDIAKVAPKPAPKTRLNIKLTGIIDGSSARGGMAMMEVDRGRTIVVAVGENIDKTDAILHQVLPGEILIDRDGSIESVKMVRKTLSIAKLESELLNSLPQPYVEDQGAETYLSPKEIDSPPSRLFEKTETQKFTDTSTNSGVSQPIPPSLPETATEPMKALPVPRMLR